MLELIYKQQTHTLTYLCYFFYFRFFIFPLHTTNHPRKRKNIFPQLHYKQHQSTRAPQQQASSTSSNPSQLQHKFTNLTSQATRTYRKFSSSDRTKKKSTLTRPSSSSSLLKTHSLCIVAGEWKKKTGKLQIVSMVYPQWQTPNKWHPSNASTRASQIPWHYFNIPLSHASILFTTNIIHISASFRLFGKRNGIHSAFDSRFLGIQGVLSKRLTMPRKRAYMEIIHRFS